MRCRGMCTCMGTCVVSWRQRDSFISVSKRCVSCARKGNIWSLSSSPSSTPANLPNPSRAAPSSPSSAPPQKTTKRSGTLAHIHVSHTLPGTSSSAGPPIRSSKCSFWYLFTLNGCQSAFQVQRNRHLGSFFSPSQSK